MKFNDSNSAVLPKANLICLSGHSLLRSCVTSLSTTTMYFAAGASTVKYEGQCPLSSCRPAGLCYIRNRWMSSDTFGYIRARRTLHPRHSFIRLATFGYVWRHSTHFEYIRNVQIRLDTFEQEELCTPQKKKE